MFRNFLQDEAGFIGALTGALGGGGGLLKSIGGIAKVVGGLFGGGGGGGPAKQVEQRVRGAVTAGKKHGIHPLEILRSGVASSHVGHQPRVMSRTAMMADGFDQLDAVLSGDEARRRQNEQFRNDLLRIEIDERRRGGLISASGRAAIGAREPGGSAAFPGGMRGAPTDTDNMQIGENAVTNPYGMTTDELVDPTLPDVDAIQARRGDGGEAIEFLTYANRYFEDKGYDAAADYVSRRTGIPKEEINRRVIENPDIRDSLPNRWERFMMDVKSLWDNRSTPGAWGDSYSEPVRPKLAPRSGSRNMSTSGFGSMSQAERAYN